LRGRAPSLEADAATVALLGQSQRRRRGSAGSALSRVRVIAADPHVYAIGTAISEANRREHRVGGRPLAYPDWCLVLFGACIRVFGSASATARALADQAVWADVCTVAQRLTGEQAMAAVPLVGPNRDHWAYFVKRRVTPAVLVQLVRLQRDLAIDRAREVGLLDTDDSYRVGGYRAIMSSASTARCSTVRYAPWTPNASTPAPG